MELYKLIEMLKKAYAVGYDAGVNQDPGAPTDYHVIGSLLHQCDGTVTEVNHEH